MDPLSISASVVALLQAVSAASKAVQVLWGLRDAQDEVDAIMNEISALESMCNQVSLALNEQGVVPQASLRSNNALQTMHLVQDSMNQSRNALDQFRDLVQGRLYKSMAQNRPPKLKKMNWLRERSNVTKLRENLRSARLQFSQSISLCDMIKSFQIEYHIDSLLIQSRAETARRIEEGETVSSAIKSSHDKVVLLETHMLSEIRALRQFISHNAIMENDSRVAEIGDSLHIETNGGGIHPHLTQTDIEANPPTIDERSPGSLIISSRPLRPQSTSCSKLWCNCVCHNPGLIRTPSYLSGIVGCLLVGYSDIPHLTPQCNIVACKKRRRIPSLRVNYFFPRWFLSRVITTSLMYSSRDGLDVHRIRVPRVIPTESAIFGHVQKGNIEGIKRLFEKGLASPYDVDQDGFSALWFTLDTPTPSLAEICRLMLSEGADPYEYVNKKNGYLPSFESAWQLILGKSIDEQTAQVLKSMFNDPDRLNDFHFSDTHKRVLKLDQHQVNTFNIDAQFEIDSMDAFGRTPLYWAIERSDLFAVSTLLRHGADPNIPTPRSGWTSMHFVARARSVDEHIIAPLLRNGAQVNALDCNNQTPLSRALRHGDSAAKIKALIAGGADINFQYDEAQWSASHLAIFLGRHDCVRVLLQSGADFSLKTVLGSNVTHFAARYADLEMMKMLGQFKSVLKTALLECPKSSREYLQAFRNERGLPPITDTWWSVWSTLLFDRAAERAVTDDTDSNSDDEFEYEDAVESF